MTTSSSDRFLTVCTEGAILPADLLRRIAAGDADLGGLDPASYHLIEGEKLNEATNRAWNRLQSAWVSFRAACDRLSPTDPAHSTTRERWLLPLFQELGYGRLQYLKEPCTIGEKSYPISHVWGHVPIHLVGCRIDLDKRTAGNPSPHSLVQEFLNRSEQHLWGFVSNGLKLRILRDNIRLTRQAYVEFDLQAMFDGKVYADFALLWRLCHQSRVEAEKPQECWLERWSQAAQQQGLRALDQLRDGVERAIAVLGRGFLSCPANHHLRERLRAGKLDAQDYYRQLLRLVYRLLFLFVAEDRELLLDPQADEAARARYRQYYSTAQLRRKAERLRGTQHTDLYQMLTLIMTRLGNDGCPELALPALGSFLFSPQAVADLEGCQLANADLLEAIRALAWTRDAHALRPVDYRNLGSEELGSIYESLLELHPLLNQETGTFELHTASGHERKTTGSYYTPTSLINCLLDSALEPVLDEAVRQTNPEAALLNLKVCDPACGSGHFLIAAAHRIAKRLAYVRTGEEEPAPEAYRDALRDVIGRCIYGVDINPMAVELCKVALWMEALVPGKPLSFLDHHIQCGNSLLGATPALLAKGIPDEAFEPIAGDDKDFCQQYRRQNRDERRGQAGLFEDEPWNRLGDLATAMLRLQQEADDTLADVQRKQQRYEELVRSSDYRFGRLWADAWCAAFVWKKRPNKALPYPITERIFRQIEHSPHHLPPWMRNEIERLAQQYQFFHWHLAFPDVFLPMAAQGNRKSGVGNTESGASSPTPHSPLSPPSPSDAGWSGGFDVVLGNPPWEQLQFDDREFFASRVQAIAEAPNMAARKKLLKNLAIDNPRLFEEYCAALQQVAAIQKFIHTSGRFPLTSYGRLNLAPLFVETMRMITAPAGRIGVIVPTGIATDAFNQYFFRNLVETRSLVSLYDFENRSGFFPGVVRLLKFCLLTLAGSERPAEKAEFAFFLHQTEQLADAERRFTLSAEDIALVNPNTRTCPIFRNRRDAELTKAIYRRVPVLVHETKGDEGDPWQFRGLLMFMMNTDSHLFRTCEQLQAEGWTLDGNLFRKGDAVYLPLYEAKMLHQFDHRWATYENGETRDVGEAEKADPHFVVQPRYWVPAAEVANRLAGKWDRHWLLGWRDICRSTDIRTVIASILPRVGVGHTLPVMLPTPKNIVLISMLTANLSSFVFDFIARQKIGGTHLTYLYLKQLPVLPPEVYEQACPWAGSTPDKASRSSVVDYAAWLLPRVLELTYTAWDLQPFARDCGYDGPPFRWDPERRFLLRCELDAAFFHLYGISRDDAAYILDTFPIVRRKDEERFGEYRTQRVILEIYDALAESARTGQPYRTRLDPPPADPRLAHSLREGSKQ
jgi:hypothetical protein